MNESPNNFSKELKPVLKEAKESLPFIKTIFLTPIAFGFALGERYLKQIAKQQEEAKKQAKMLSQQKRAEEREMRIEEREALETAKIAEEKRAEERARKLREEERRMTPRKIFHTCMAATSTVALVIGVARLAPIAEWAVKVNECIKESSLNGDINMSYRDKFRGCSSGKI